MATVTTHDDHYVRDQVSEQRSPTSLLLILQGTYEHGEPCWNDTDRGKHLILPPELCGNLHNSAL
jgi:hypothetical protein